MDFDRIVDRRGTGALKWDRPAPGVVPLWVADMDFPSPPEVAEALRRRVDHGIYGYTDSGDGFYEALIAWYRERYGVPARREDLLLGPGAVPSLAIAARTFAGVGEGVLIMSPVYYPFAETIRNNGRVVVPLSLKLDGSGRFAFYADELARRVRESEAAGVRVPLLFFCSPHNPSGTVWRKEELEALLETARGLDMIVVSDEIHADIVHGGREFFSLARFGEFADRVVVLSSANKTFNLAGLHLSHFLAADQILRERLRGGLAAAGFSQPNVFALVAAEAAYRRGGPWLEALLEYIAGNMDYALETLNRPGSGIRAYPCEGTYLLWADASVLIGRTGLRNDKVLATRLEEEAGVKCTPGGAFGPEGEGFLRINLACPRSQLAEGLRRLLEWEGTRPKSGI